MTTYNMDEWTLLKEAVRFLVRNGVDISDQALRYRLFNRQVEGMQIAERWFVLNTELTKIIAKEGRGHEPPPENRTVNY